LDELVGGAREAAWPLIRSDFALSYLQIGLLMTIPGLFSAFVEPVLGILADTRLRRSIFVGGGFAFALSILLTGISRGPLFLLFSWVMFYPASGAFVNVAQIGLMDLETRRREQNMARWSLAGSIGMTAGPLALAFAASHGLGWRGLYLFMGMLSCALLAPAWMTRIPQPRSQRQQSASWRTFLRGLGDAVKALRKADVLRWLTLLELSDLMLDILFGFIGLYFVDVAGVSIGIAAVAVVLWTASGLVGDALVIPLLERVAGVPYLRSSAALAAVLFPSFLLIPPLPLKFGLLILLGLVKAGWYSVLKARLYAAMPRKGGAAMALSTIAGLAGSLIPLGLGAVAQVAGLRAAMWILMAAPIALLLGLPRQGQRGVRKARRS